MDAAAHVGLAPCRTGKLNPEKAKALGVMPGKGFGTLKAGMPVENKGERCPSKACKNLAVIDCFDTCCYSPGKERPSFLTSAVAAAAHRFLDTSMPVHDCQARISLHAVPRRDGSLRCMLVPCTTPRTCLCLPGGGNQLHLASICGAAGETVEPCG